MKTEDCGSPLKVCEAVKRMLRKETEFTNRFLSVRTQILIGAMVSIVMIIIALKYGLKLL
jgi:hypothetical protein